MGRTRMASGVALSLALWAAACAAPRPAPAAQRAPEPPPPAPRPVATVAVDAAATESEVDAESPTQPTPFHAMAVLDGEDRVWLHDLETRIAIVYGPPLAQQLLLFDEQQGKVDASVRRGLPEGQIFALAGRWPHAAYALVLTENSTVSHPGLYRRRAGAWQRHTLSARERPEELFRWHDGVLALATDNDAVEGFKGASWSAVGTKQAAPRLSANSKAKDDDDCRVAVAPAAVAITAANEVVLAGCSCATAAREQDGRFRCDAQLETWGAKGGVGTVQPVGAPPHFAPRALFARTQSDVEVLLEDADPDGSHATVLVARFAGGRWQADAPARVAHVDGAAVTGAGEFWLATRERVQRREGAKWLPVALPNLESHGAPAGAAVRWHSLQALRGDVWLAGSFQQERYRYRTVLFRSRAGVGSVIALP